MSYPLDLLCNADSAMMLPVGGNANIAGPDHPISIRLTEQQQNLFLNFPPWGLSYYKEADHGSPAWSNRTVSRMDGQNPNYLDPMPITIRMPQARISGNNTTLEANRIPARYPAIYSGGPTDNVNCVLLANNEIQLMRGFTWEHHNSTPRASSVIKRSIFHRWHGTAPGDRHGPSASGVFNMFGIVHGAIINVPGLEIPHALQFVGAVCSNIPANKQLFANATVLPATTVDRCATEAGGGNGPMPYGTLLTYPHDQPMPSGMSEPGQRLWRAIRNYGLYGVDGSTTSLRIRCDQHVTSTVQSQIANDGPKIMIGLRPVLMAGANPNSGAPLPWAPGITTKGGGTPRAQNFGHGNGATPPPPSTSEPTVLNAIARRLEEL